MRGAQARVVGGVADRPASSPELTRLRGGILAVPPWASTPSAGGLGGNVLMTPPCPGNPPETVMVGNFSLLLGCLLLAD